MPEGHATHRLAGDHTKWFAGQRLKVASPQGRFEEGAQLLSGRTLKSVAAHGKHLFYCFAGGHVMHVHLGLYGKFRLHKGPPPEPRGAVRVRLIGKAHALDLNGPNQCEAISSKDAMRSMARLGPDPLRDDADPERVWDRIRKSKKAIGSLLLDQSIIAGIGNIYRAEILFLQGVHPSRPSNSIQKSEFDRIWERSVELLKIGVKYNRIVTVQREPDGKPLSRLGAGERLWVYKKKSCPRCGSKIESWLLGSRRIYACPACQK